jgi:hypothetical protein
MKKPVMAQPASMIINRSLSDANCSMALDNKTGRLRRRQRKTK